MKNNFSKKNMTVSRKGFSLLEMIVAIFIFSLVMTTVTTIFVKIFNARKKTKEIQINIEDARASMELMAKSLRMSNVKSGDAASADNIVVYDYSQNKCIKYYKDSSNKLRMISETMSDDTNCTASYSIPGTAQTMMNGVLNNLSLNVEESVKTAGSKKVGKVTIAMTICADTTIPCKTQETIQTTVSLRDYGYIMNP